ncbi:hypothetical protein [Brevundimonas sp.]|uniref:hypothetical protein n=1 Tax=Brevundimonas sp. TaxID=1871086 RepID=UPI003D11B6A9
MTIHKDKTISGPIELDGNTFENVAFKDAQILYLGGVPPMMNNCSFDGVTFEFRGPAHNTLMFLRSLMPARTNMRPILEALMPELKA